MKNLDESSWANFWQCSGYMWPSSEHHADIPQKKSKSVIIEGKSYTMVSTFMPSTCNGSHARRIPGYNYLTTMMWMVNANITWIKAQAARPLIIGLTWSKPHWEIVAFVWLLSSPSRKMSDESTMSKSTMPLYKNREWYYYQSLPPTNNFPGDWMLGVIPI